MCVGTCVHTCGSAPTSGFGPVRSVWAVFYISWELDWQPQVARSPSSLPTFLPQGLSGAWLISAALASELPWAGTGLGGGAHLLPHPRLSLCSDHCPALPLYSLNTPLQCPPPFLPAFTAPCPKPHLLISLSSGSTPPGSLPCCPRCQLLSLRGPRVQTGSVFSLLGPLLNMVVSAVSLSVPINRPRAPWGLVLHQIQLFLVPSLGS